MTIVSMYKWIADKIGYATAPIVFLLFIVTGLFVELGYTYLHYLFVTILVIFVSIVLFGYIYHTYIKDVKEEKNGSRGS
jgi:anaerobic C4-dicarboxylate transporter